MIDLLAEKLEPSFDIINQKLQSDNITVHLLYLKTVVDNDQIQNYIIKPFF